MILALVLVVSWAVLSRQERLHRRERMNFLTVAQRREEEMRPAKDLADIGLLLSIAITLAEVTGLFLWSAYRLSGDISTEHPIMREATIQQSMFGAVCLGLTIALIVLAVNGALKNFRYRRWMREHPGGPLDE